MDLTELVRRTGIERRKLRYVLDQQLVPELRINVVDDEVGRPRQFADDVGLAIVCAAKLLDLGLAHDTIRDFLSGLIYVKFQAGDSQTALVHLLGNEEPACAEFGDGRTVRIRAQNDATTPWTSLKKPHRQVADFSPMITVTLDLGQIRDQVFESG